MTIGFYYCLIALMAVVSGGVSGAGQSLADQCASKLPAVMTCVSFASGKEAAPEKKCCDSVTEMKESNPACLCFLIQQIHNGTNPALKQMNIQESRLLQLPSACKIANASITNCPKLLNLPPNSPDAAIFTNTTATSPAVGGTTSSPSTTTQAAGSLGFKHGAPKLVGSILIPVMLMLLFFVIDLPNK